MNTIHTIQMKRQTDVIICVWVGREICEVYEVCRKCYKEKAVWKVEQEMKR
jgi:hypothetical protein